MKVKNIILLVIGSLVSFSAIASSDVNVDLEVDAQAACANGKIGVIFMRPNRLISIRINNGDDSNPTSPQDFVFSPGATAALDSQGNIIMTQNGRSIVIGSFDSAQFQADCSVGRYVDEGNVNEIAPVKLSSGVSVQASRVVHSCSSYGFFDKFYYRDVDYSVLIQSGEQKIALVPSPVLDSAGRFESSLLFNSMEDCESWQGTWSQVP